MGQRHRAITLDDGTVIFDVLGAAEDDGDDEGDDEEGKPKSKGPTAKELRERAEAAEADSRKYQRRLKAADRDKMRYKNELEKLQSGDKGDLAKARSEIEDLKAKLAAASGQDKPSKIREEFLSDDTYAWQNRKAALKLLDLDEIDVDDKGKLDAASYKDAVKALAKDNPWLLKPADDPKNSQRDDEDEDDEEEKERPSGRQPKPRNRNRRPSQDKTKMVETYPILGRR